MNKADLPAVVGATEVHSRFCDDSPVVSLSALAPEDIARLRDTLESLMVRKPLESLGSSVIPNLRHRVRLQAACDSLRHAVDAILGGSPPELTALELRAARRELEAVLGLDGNEEVLDQIFSRFCIGK
jgi:tRNA modification GTPase